MAKQQKLHQKQSEKRAIVTPESTRGFDWAPYFIFLFSFVIYANTIPNDYNLDDELVTQNHRLTSKGISAIPEIFTSPYYEDKAGYKYEYRPIVLISFAIPSSSTHCAVLSPKVSFPFPVWMPVSLIPSLRGTTI